MKIIELNKVIKDYTEGRYKSEPSESFSNFLLELDAKKLEKKDVFRIKRISQNDNTNSENWKTLLIVEIQEKNEINSALEWSAIVKDALLDPETADLYLFIIFDGNDINLTIDECYSIESSEQYCRKYVQKPDKTAIELLERTFLSKMEEIQQQGEVVDPINTAIALTAEKHSWFTNEEQKRWRNILLSNNSGNDLIDLLFSEKTN